MDHFNATVQDGHMVATRRGLRVSKQKFNGLSFVNSYAQSYSGDSDATVTAAANNNKPADNRPGSFAKQYRFVQRGRDARREGTATKQAQQAHAHAHAQLQTPQAQTQTRVAAPATRGPPLELKFVPDGTRAQPKRSRMRTPAHDRASPAASSTSSCSPTSDTASSASSPTVSHYAFGGGGTGEEPRQRLTFFPPPSPSSWSNSSINANNMQQQQQNQNQNQNQQQQQQQPGVTETAAAGTATGVDGVIPGLSAWTTQDLPSFMSDETRRQFEHFCAHIPRKMCPYEDVVTYNPFHPSRENNFYQMVVRDLAAIHCVLMCGSVADDLVAERPDADGFNYHIARICSILNRKLDQNKCVDSITVFCIFALASMGVVVGRLDHWHMHMNGLRKLMELNGGLRALWPGLRAKVHEVDIKGATVLGTVPYFPFVRCYPPISADLPLFPGTPPSATLSALLRPLGVAPAVVDGLASLAQFAGAVALSRASGGAILFDPYVCADDWLGTTHDLLTLPTPLRSATATTTTTSPAAGSSSNSSSSSNRGSPPPPPTNDPFCVAEPGQSYTANYRLSNHAAAQLADEAAALCARSAGGPLEPALRLAGLLLLKELMCEYPHNLGGYGVLLALLDGCMRALLMRARARRRRQGQGQGSYHHANVNHHHLRHGNHNRSSDTNDDDDENNNNHPFPLPLPLPFDTEAAAARPAVLWVCGVGALACRLANTNERRSGDGDGDCYDASVYRRCAVEVAGLADAADVDALTDEGDLRMFRLLDPRNTKGAQAARWDERGALRELVEG